MWFLVGHLFIQWHFVFPLYSHLVWPQSYYVGICFFARRFNAVVVVILPSGEENMLWRLMKPKHVMFFLCSIENILGFSLNCWFGLIEFSWFWFQFICVVVEEPRALDSLGNLALCFVPTKAQKVCWLALFDWCNFLFYLCSLVEALPFWLFTFLMIFSHNDIIR
jgi:hypothetical protein